MSNCFKCGRDLGPKEEYMKMATQNGKICYVCYNKYAAEERMKAEGKNPEPLRTKT